MSGDHDKYHGTAEVPKREWVGLTKEETLELFEKYHDRPFSLILATSDKLKEKNA
jgi:hypothetical protein